MYRVTVLLILFLPGVLHGQNFTEITQSPIGQDEGYAQGVSIVDVNSDGYLDIYVANGSNEQNLLFLGSKDGEFEKVSDSPLVMLNKRSNAAAWADFNNDAAMDLYISNAGGENNELYSRHGDSFVTLTEPAPAQDASSSLGAAWGDYNADGYVDLFVANGYRDERNILYRNEGDGSFSVVGNEPVSAQAHYSWQGSWADIDNDGDLDLYVVNANGVDNSLYINDAGSFHERMDGPLVNDSAGTNGASWADIDNDRDLDLFVSNGEGANFLYRNMGDGTFKEIHDVPPVTDSYRTSGSCWADFDNDGYIDLYVVAGRDGNPRPNKLFMNEGDGDFKEIEDSELINKINPSNGVSAACGDYNRDGYPDIFVANWNGYNNSLYKNEGGKNNWAVIRLNAQTSNRAAVGAKISLLSTIDGEKQWQYRTVRTSTGHRSQNSLQAEFGLDDARQIDSLVVEWPSGMRQVKTDLVSNQYITVKEDKRPTDLKLEIGSIAGIPGDTMKVPVHVEIPHDSSFSSLEFEFSFDRDLAFVGLDTANTLVSENGWLISANREGDQLHISAAGSESISDGGKLMRLGVQLPEEPSNRYEIAFLSALFNTSYRPHIMRSGYLIVPDFGDVDMSGRVQAYDASLILQYLLRDHTLGKGQRYFADVSRDSQVTAMDASYILQYTTGAIDQLPLNTESEQIVADADIYMQDKEVEGSTVQVPVKVRHARHLYAYSGLLTYNPEQLKYEGISNSVDRNVSATANQQKGEIRFSAAEPNAMKEKADLVTAIFKVRNDKTDVNGTVALKSIRLNEAEVRSNVDNSRIVTDIIGEESRKDQPDNIRLKQNYPNPFNPVTVIEYTLTDKAHITLYLYSIQGKRLRVLDRGTKSSGRHQVTLRAKDLSSGIYYYRLKTNEGITRTRKAMLIR